MIRVDKLQLDVIINGDPVRSEILKIEKEARELKKSMVGIKDQELLGKKQAELNAMNKRMEDLRHEIGLTGMTFKELQQRSNTLKQAFVHMLPGTAEHTRVQKELLQIKARMDQIGVSAKNIAGQGGPLASFFGGLKNQVKQFGATMLAAFSVYAIVGYFKEGIAAAIKMKDAERLLLVELEGNKKVQKQLIALADERSRSTKYTRLEILEAEKFLAIQKRSPEQIQKTIVAATELAALMGGSFDEAVKMLDGTMEGKLGKGLGKIEKAFKDCTKEQLYSGAAIDIVANKYKGIAENEMNTTEGKLNLLGKAWKGLRRAVGDLFVNSNYFNGAITGATSFLKAVKDNLGTVVFFMKAIASLTLGLIAYKGAVYITSNLLEIQNGIKKASIVITNLFTGATRAATVAEEGLNAATKANPWAAVISLIISAASALLLFKKNSGAASENMNILSDAYKNYNDNLATEKAQLDMRFDRLKQTNYQDKARKTLIDEINSTYGTTIQNLKDEKQFVAQLTSTYDNLLISLQKTALQSSRTTALSEIYKKEFEAKQEYEDQKAKLDEVAYKKFDYNTQRWVYAIKEGADIDAVGLMNLQGSVEVSYGKMTNSLNDLAKQRKALMKFSPEEEKILNSGNTAKIVHDNIINWAKKTEDELKEYIAQAAEQGVTKEDKLLGMQAKTELSRREKLGINLKKSNKDIEKDYEQLMADIQQITKVDFANTLTETEKQIKDVQDKYLKLKIEKDQFLKDTEGRTDQKTLDKRQTLIDSNLEQKEADEIQNVYEVSYKKLFDSVKQLHENLRVARMSQTEKEVYEINKKYDQGIEDQKKACIANYDAQIALAEGNKTKILALEIEKQQKLAKIDGLNSELNEMRQKELNTTNLKANERFYEDLANLTEQEDTKVAKTKAQRDRKIEAEAKKKFKGVLKDAGIDAKKIGEVELSMNDWINREKKKQDRQSFLDKLKMAVDFASQVANSISTITKNNNQKELDNTLAKLERQKEAELSNKNLTEDQKTAINDKYTKLENKEKNEAAKKQRDNDLIMAAVNAALAAIKGFAEGGYLGAALGLAAGIAAIAVIESEPIPQYAEGLYNTKGKDDGKTYMAKIIKNAGTGMINDPAILVGEKPEMIVGVKDMKNPNILSHVNSILKLKQGLPEMNYPMIQQALKASAYPQYAAGMYPQKNTTVTRKEMFTDPKLTKAIERFNDVMDNVEKNGLHAYTVMTESEKMQAKRDALKKNFNI